MKKAVQKILLSLFIFSVTIGYSYERDYAETVPNQPNVVSEGTLTIFDSDAVTKKPLHAVVLNGYDEKYVYVMNPLKGNVKYNTEYFFYRDNALESHTIIVAPKF
ncbi:hypothetical protein [Bacillus xiapuensis]|uniref:Uncharacterized protein n=1 Tax=Bacillus xiapuensis TaxID=2014075 RepID=A0ABU6NDN8_9BACI|nr:hypothetical protein [Bacillus xiapuensis]